MSENIGKGHFVAGTLKWMYELNMLDNPAVISNLYENLFLAHKGIQDIEIVLSKENKTILVFLKLGLYARIFKRLEVQGKVTSVIKTLLPEYRFRITEDKAVLEAALNKARAYDKTFESGNNIPNISDDPNS